VVFGFDYDGFVRLAHVETVPWTSCLLTCDPDPTPHPPMS
jgi:hypothetical protein